MHPQLILRNSFAGSSSTTRPASMQMKAGPSRFAILAPGTNLCKFAALSYPHKSSNSTNGTFICTVCRSVPFRLVWPLIYVIGKFSRFIHSHVHVPWQIDTISMIHPSSSALCLFNMYTITQQQKRYHINDKYNDGRGTLNASQQCQQQNSVRILSILIYFIKIKY
jgi:hypothetical protein